MGTLLLKKVGDKIFHHYKKLVTQTSSGNVLIPISNDELGGLQYLSGYVVHKFLKKTRKQKNNAIVLKILENMVSPDDNDQDLIDVQNRVGLMCVLQQQHKRFF